MWLGIELTPLNSLSYSWSKRLIYPMGYRTDIPTLEDSIPLNSDKYRTFAPDRNDLPKNVQHQE